MVRSRNTCCKQFLHVDRGIVTQTHDPNHDIKTHVSKHFQVKQPQEIVLLPVQTLCHDECHVGGPGLLSALQIP